MTRDFTVNGHATLQQKGADLIFNAGTLIHQSFSTRCSVCKSTRSAIFVAMSPASVVQLRSTGRSHWYDRDDLVTAIDDGDDVCVGSCAITIGSPRRCSRRSRVQTRTS
jgi:hypothetical protein